MTAPRLNPFKSAPKVMQSMMTHSAEITGDLDHTVVELVKLRASQINGCAFCLKMHADDARKAGETDDRIVLLNAWRESRLYTDRERAALAWTEALTGLAEHGAPDTVYETLKAQFSDEEQVRLTVLIGNINAWNRIQVGFNAVHA